MVYLQSCVKWVKRKSKGAACVREIWKRWLFQEERQRGVGTPAENKSRGAHELALLATHGIAPPCEERLRLGGAGSLAAEHEGTKHENAESTR
jgi:hypothetical protein